MMTVKFFFSAKLKLIGDNWEFISVNALSLLHGLQGLEVAQFQRGICLFFQVSDLTGF